MLARRPEVQEVLVTVVSNGQRENRLVAGVVARVGTRVTGEGCGNICRSRYQATWCRQSLWCWQRCL